MNEQHYQRTIANLETKLDTLTSAFVFFTGSVRASLPTASIPDMDDVYKAMDKVDALSVRDRMREDHGAATRKDSETRIKYELVSRRKAIQSLDKDSLSFTDTTTEEGIFRNRTSPFNNSLYIVKLKLEAPESLNLMIELERYEGSMQINLMAKGHDGRFKTVDMNASEYSGDIYNYISETDFAQALDRVLEKHGVAAKEDFEESDVLELFALAYAEDNSSFLLPPLNLRIARSVNLDKIVWKPDSRMYGYTRHLGDKWRSWSELNPYLKDSIVKQLMQVSANKEKPNE